jgi:hypothetical protein
LSGNHAAVTGDNPSSMVSQRGVANHYDTQHHHGDHWTADTSMITWDGSSADLSSRRSSSLSQDLNGSGGPAALLNSSRGSNGKPRLKVPPKPPRGKRMNSAM